MSAHFNKKAWDYREDCPEPHITPTKETGLTEHEEAAIRRAVLNQLNNGTLPGAPPTPVRDS